MLYCVKEVPLTVSLDVDTLEALRQLSVKLGQTVEETAAEILGQGIFEATNRKGWQ